MSFMTTVKFENSHSVINHYWGVIIYRYLIEEAKDLASSLLGASLLVIHNTVCGGEDDVSEATRGQHVVHPLLHLLHKYQEIHGIKTITYVNTAVKAG